MKREDEAGDMLMSENHQSPARRRPYRDFSVPLAIIAALKSGWRTAIIHRRKGAFACKDAAGGRVIVRGGGSSALICAPMPEFQAQDE